MDDIKFPENEEKILKFWKENKIFEKSITNRSIDNPVSFYDGPPFVTGVPHYGHLLGSIAKDIIPRYLTMKGKRVRRVWGWDCHGLPIENKVEQKLGLKNRRDIEKIGLEKFIGECQSYVLQISREWDWYVDHVGRWVDMEHAYKTMDLKYMESVIWVFKQLYDKGLIYKGMRISLFCPRCSTPISNFEIAMDSSYADREDTAITMKFEVTDSELIRKHQLTKPCYLLAWTTTPWSSVSVMGLAINNDFKYSIVETAEAIFIVASKRAEAMFGGQDYKVIIELEGKDISGLKYRHLFDYYDNQFTDFKTYPTDYVSEEEGTGIVTINGAFGDVDMQSAKKFKLPIIVNVDEEGKYTPEVLVAPGIYVKDAEVLVIEDLKKRELLFKEERIIHSYPLCYRCETPLIYRGQDSWFINIEKLKPRLSENNQKINWVPEHFKNGRFLEGIKSAPDWCISRTRYWATAMPIWECNKCEKREVFGSIKDIEERSGHKVTDLHRPFIDTVVFPCDCGGEFHRVKEVLDCWMESGSMPYSERHYPFENKEEFEKSFPADYISEYTGQVRAWFYVLHVLSTALMSSNSYKNVVVSGVIMGTDGRKMSKSFHNYPDPRLVIEKYGGDALRLYLMGSPTMAGQDMNISEEKIAEQVKRVLLIYWNCYKYFQMAKEMNNFTVTIGPYTDSKNVMDKWIYSRTNGFINNFSNALDGYHIPEATRLVPEYLDDLSRWYIRRSRDRLKDNDPNALNTLHRCLMMFTITSAPLIPFLTETIYREIGGAKESVHLEDWIVVNKQTIDETLESNMIKVREIAAMALAERAEKGIKARQPLGALTININLPEEFLGLLKDEVNVKNVVVDEKFSQLAKLSTEITDELKEEGMIRDIVRDIQEHRKEIHLTPKDKIKIIVSGNKSLVSMVNRWQEVIKEKTIAGELLVKETEQEGATEPVFNSSGYDLLVEPIK
ncbi:MAG: isoleucine--tRNA ligase [bacterium]